MRRYKVKLLANSLQTLPVAGVYIRVITAADAFSIAPDTGQELAGLEAGMGWTADKPFQTLNLLSDTEQTVEIMAGVGRIDDDRANIEGNIDATSKGATVETSSETLSTTAAEVLAVDATRRSVIIQNIDAAIDVFVGGATLSAANGLLLSAGQSVTIDKAAGAALWAVADSGTPELRILAELD